ncbi:hypothetical protein BVRB_035740 [Beta vulgaris subsp. vulgaris]|uniref:Uncharacterized protein n=1 Tax=Beta vulgaris subsp. vulgaris TaxID=3555 RepID=A0A0J7YQQ0_BETVV|nr:hypothetical protein BVRB_035740 [Beta vulgaris subsp. vulgaris]
MECATEGGSESDIRRRQPGSLISDMRISLIGQINLGSGRAASSSVVPVSSAGRRRLCDRFSPLTMTILEPEQRPAIRADRGF